MKRKKIWMKINKTTGDFEIIYLICILNWIKLCCCICAYTLLKLLNCTAISSASRLVHVSRQTWSTQTKRSWNKLFSYLVIYYNYYCCCSFAYLPRINVSLMCIWVSAMLCYCDCCCLKWASIHTIIICCLLMSFFSHCGVIFYFRSAFTNTSRMQFNARLSSDYAWIRSIRWWHK